VRGNVGMRRLDMPRFSASTVDIVYAQAELSLRKSLLFRSRPVRASIDTPDRSPDPVNNLYASHTHTTRMTPRS
jgi:hypothetical protein